MAGNILPNAGGGRQRDGSDGSGALPGVGGMLCEEGRKTSMCVSRNISPGKPLQEFSERRKELAELVCKERVRCLRSGTQEYFFHLLFVARAVA